ncbi:MAG: UbiA family prenyltransferase [Ekhidna sp.]
MNRFYSVLQYLSIDIVIGAVILLRFFCAQSGIEIDFPVYFLLASAVWLIYTTDHIRDSRGAKHPKRPRYLFHERNEGALKLAMVMVVFFCVMCVFTVPMMILFTGCTLGILSLIYLSIQRWLSMKGLKELYVSIIYTSGILLVPFFLGQEFSWLSFILLLIATYLNLILFSWFEKEEDKKDKFDSIATTWGEKRVLKLILILLSVGISLSIFSFNLIAMYFLFVFLMYTLVFLREQQMSKGGIYRIIGDGVFVIPILFELSYF